jgi:DmsE family decaheme c-type cytochrome
VKSPPIPVSTLFRLIVGIFGGVVIAVILLNCSSRGSSVARWEDIGPPTIKDAVYIGWEACLQCHQDQAQKMAHTLHGKILGTTLARTDLQRHGCEACHGPGSKHVEDPTNPANHIRFSSTSIQSVAGRNATCLQCHDKGRRLFWQGSPHESRDVSCTSCHSIKTPRTERAQLKAPTQLELCSQCHAVKAAMFQNWSHMPVREGKLQCSSCHNVHGTITEKLIPENSINESCYNCHADKRGPFLHEHPPVRENCLNCHVAHGSNNVRLLRTRVPRLCQECHDQSGHPSTAFSNLADRRILGRACASCHVNIHGSNHPSGFAFTR